MTGVTLGEDSIALDSQQSNYGKLTLYKIPPSVILFISTKKLCNSYWFVSLPLPIWKSGRYHDLFTSWNVSEHMPDLTLLSTVFTIFDGRLFKSLESPPSVYHHMTTNSLPFFFSYCAMFSLFHCFNFLTPNVTLKVRNMIERPGFMTSLSIWYLWKSKLGHYWK